MRLNSTVARVAAAAAAATALAIPMSSASAAITMATPNLSMELQHNSDGTTTQRVVAYNIPASATYLKFQWYKDGAWRADGSCHVSRLQNGDGSSGCAFGVGGSGWKERAYYVDANGNRSGFRTYYVSAMTYDVSGSNRYYHGTTDYLWVRGNADEAARLGKTIYDVTKAQASGCLSDAAVSAAIAGFKKAAGSKWAYKNPYTAGAAAITLAIAKMDSKVFSNRCKAIGNLSREFWQAYHRVQGTNAQARVFLTTRWMALNNLPDECLIVTSDGGGDGGTGAAIQDNEKIITRPSWEGGPDKASCLGFWNSIVR